MNLYELMVGVYSNHKTFLNEIGGGKLLQIGSCSRGAFAVTLARAGADVTVDGAKTMKAALDLEPRISIGSGTGYDTVYTQWVIDTLPPKDVVKLIKKSLKAAPRFVFAVRAPTWHGRRSLEAWRDVLKSFKVVKLYLYWRGRMICGVVEAKTPEPIAEVPAAKATREAMTQALKPEDVATDLPTNVRAVKKKKG